MIRVLLAILPFAWPGSLCAEIITYEFTARITDNGGVTPFKVGTYFTGKFVGDTDGRNRLGSDKRIAIYESPKHMFLLRYEKSTFFTNGGGLVDVGNHGTGSHFREIFGATWPKLNTPSGWKVNTGVGRGPNKFSVGFGNQSTKRLLRDKEMPRSIDPTEFTTAKVYLMFEYGVEFPGGMCDGRTCVIANIETVAVVLEGDEPK